VDAEGIPLEPERSVRRTIFSLTGYGQSVTGRAPAKGSAFGIGLGAEGEHWGVLGQWNGFYLDSLSGPGTDSVNLVHLQLTYAVLSGERGLVGAASGAPTLRGRTFDRRVDGPGTARAARPRGAGERHPHPLRGERYQGPWIGFGLAL
jgi:hypothetical protein